VNVTVERIAGSQVRLQIAADQEEHAKAVDKAYRRLAQDIVIPGFRKGKAPRSMIERFYGRDVFVEEANRSLMDDLYREALEREEIVPVGDPEVESIDPDPLSFTVTVPVYPTVDPGDYASVRTDPVDASLDESLIDETLEELRKSQSPWVDPSEERKPKEGDQVTVDIRIMDGDEEFQKHDDNQFIIGETNLLDELRAAIESLALAETTSVDIPFPEDDDRFQEDDPRRGKTMTYHVTLKGIKERDLLPLDDEFAKTYGNAESMEELSDRLRANLHAEKTREARSEAVNAIFEKLNELATIEVPEAMVDSSVEERFVNLRNRLQYSGLSLEAYLRQTGQTEDQVREELRPSAERGLRTSLILREIAEREGIEVSEADLEGEIEDITAQAPQRDQMREAYMQNQYLRSALRNDLFDQRLTDRLIEIATEGRGAVLNGFEPPAPSVETTEITGETPGRPAAQESAAVDEPSDGDTAELATESSGEEDKADAS
jgi:trigger factor